MRAYLSGRQDTSNENVSYVADAHRPTWPAAVVLLQPGLHLLGKLLIPLFLICTRLNAIVFSIYVLLDKGELLLARPSFSLTWFVSLSSQQGFKALVSARKIPVDYRIVGPQLRNSRMLYAWTNNVVWGVGATSHDCITRIIIVARQKVLTAACC